MRLEAERERLDEGSRKKKNNKLAKALINDMVKGNEKYAVARTENIKFKEHTISKEKEMNIKATQQK